MRMPAAPTREFPAALAAVKPFSDRTFDERGALCTGTHQNSCSDPAHRRPAQTRARNRANLPMTNDSDVADETLRDIRPKKWGDRCWRKYVAPSNPSMACPAT